MEQEAQAARNSNATQSGVPQSAFDQSSVVNNILTTRIGRRGMKAQRLIATVAALLICSIALADDDGSSQVSIEEGGIAPQALDTALEEFAERSGLQVIYLAEIAKGKQSLGAQPDLSDQATLDQLLASTDLEYEFLNDDTVTLQAVADQGGASNSKNSNPAPMLMAQNTSSPTQTTASSRSDEGTTSVVTGRVTDARTGANLKGARVTIAETGQWVSTGDLGRFRLTSIPNGSFTLTVSFLGYAGQSTVIGVRGEPVSQDFALRGGSDLEEIIVYGSRSSRALSLNQERTAQTTSTVVSSDLLGHLPGTTISETLRRVPGVAFDVDPETGDGANIIIRGLQPDLNQVQLNGVRLAETSGGAQDLNNRGGRSPDMSGILTESIESVTITKVLKPSHDSNGVGGFVEIETKSPLDRDRRFANFGFETSGLDNDFVDENLYFGTVSGTFLDDQSFGLSLSAQFRDRSTTSVSYDISGPEFGQYLPEGIRSPSQIDPRETFPFIDGVAELYPRGVTANSLTRDDETFSITGSAQKIIADHTDLRFDATLTEIKTSRQNAGVQFSDAARYRERPIDELGGELRYALTTENTNSNFPGINSGGPSRSLSLTPQTEETVKTFSFRGETALDQWAFDYGLGYSKGESTTPESLFFSPIEGLFRRFDIGSFFLGARRV